MQLYFGMAQWHHPAWVGWLLLPQSANNRRLADYATFFNAVEVGSSFYADLSNEQIENWYNQVPANFRFSFKVPQKITHQLTSNNLKSCLDNLGHFCELIRPISDKLGVTMMQFPATLSADSLNLIDSLCSHWRLSTPLAVEVRHLSFFDKGKNERALLKTLADQGKNRVIMDSRPVFSTVADSESLLDAQKKKPKVPCHPVLTDKHPIVRFIGHPNLSLNDHYLEQWAKKLIEWMQVGITPYVFVHSADNVAAPILAAMLEEKIVSYCPSYQPSLMLPSLQQQESLF
ncbi:DUF72 domain-containing protein [Marinomonas agarivorans]|nr:DUF72 domain-containing protein [Marinomonas agarivorans]